MEYFNIKYVNDGMYFRVKSDNPPTPPIPLLYLYNAIDDTEDEMLNAAPSVENIPRGGKSPTGGRDITVIDYPNIGIIDLS